MKWKPNKKKTNFNKYSNYMLLAKAFTLSEVLITLVIIGVVAAITTPMLMNNTNDNEYNVARQKAKATIGEAFKLMTVNGEIDKDKSTADFVKEVLPKYLKIAKTCGNGEEAAKNCGFVSKIKRPDGSITSMPLTWQTLTSPVIFKSAPSAANANDGTTETFNKPDQNEGYFLQTLDGFSLNFFYNPYCVGNKKEKIVWYDVHGDVQQSMDVVCFNAVYDMNGTKGPNQVGKDIGFVGSFYNSYETTAEAVLPHKDEIATETIAVDATKHWHSAMDYCKNLEDNNKWILPNVDELSLLFLNRNLVRDGSLSKFFWSRSTFLCVSANVPCFNRVLFSSGSRSWEADYNTVNYLRCVRNNT